MNSGDKVYDIVGVGFGPANLALALAIREYNERAGPHKLAAAFLERQPQFGWHLGMLIEGATMQVSFLKDLATMRNPTSGFTFINYLHERGRLADFINLKEFFPTRVEFQDYLQWCAAHVTDLVVYDREVTRVVPVFDGAGDIEVFDVQSRHPSSGAGVPRLRTRNIVVATGLIPQIPGGVVLADRIWHSSQLLARIPELDDDPPRSVAVVGAGQSAAEAAAYLHDRFRGAEVYCVMQRYGYSPSDDTPFVNRVFDPAAVEDFYRSAPEARERIRGYHANTNYSVVDESLIDELYRREYQESVSGQARLVMRPLRRLNGATTGAGGSPVLDLTHLTSGAAERLDVDLLVLATGYRQMDPMSVFQDLQHEFRRDSSGRLRVSRFYRVVTSDVVRGGIYVQGGTEHSHGLSSSLLSNVAVRAGEILDSVLDRSTTETVGR